MFGAWRELHFYSGLYVCCGIVFEDLLEIHFNPSAVRALPLFAAIHMPVHWHNIYVLIEQVFMNGAEWDSATGTRYRMVLDENGNPIRVDWKPGGPRKGVWDVGHVPGVEYRRLRDRYLDPNGDLDYDGFMRECHRLENLEVQHWKRNQSHTDELP